jgi:hypothetical protein
MSEQRTIDPEFISCPICSQVVWARDGVMVQHFVHHGPLRPECSGSLERPRDAAKRRYG